MQSFNNNFFESFDRKHLGFFFCTGSHIASSGDPSLFRISDNLELPTNLAAYHQSKGGYHLSVCKAGGSGREELKREHPPSPAVL